MVGDASGDRERGFWWRAGVVWAAIALFVLALCLPAVRIDDGARDPGRTIDLTLGSRSGWWVFWVGLLYLGPDWRFVTWLANPAFGLAAVFLLAGRARAAAGCGTLAVGLGAVSWVAVGGEPGRWLLAGYYVWQAAHLLVALAAWWWVVRGTPSHPTRPGG
jgi:hypothetical protein